MGDIFYDIKQSFKDGNVMTKVIFANIAVFVMVNLFISLSFLFGSNPPDLINWLAVPSYLPALLIKPWTLFTYMFLHEGFLHLLFNMIWLYFGGRILLDLLGEKRFISTYILGGLSGALLYIISYNIFPVFSDVLPVARAMGASASVLAIIVAIATKVPNYTVHLLFLGPVKLKYIAIFSVVLDLISFQDGNAGGHLAHIGGAIFGFVYIRQMEKGRDISTTFHRIVSALTSIFKKSDKKNIKVVYRKNKNDQRNDTHQNQSVVDKILDKISRSGYDSLSKEEKDILFKASQKN